MAFKRDYKAIQRYTHYLIHINHKYSTGEHRIYSRHTSYKAAIHAMKIMVWGAEQLNYRVVDYYGFICDNEGKATMDYPPVKLVYGQSCKEKKAEKEKAKAAAQ